MASASSERVTVTMPAELVAGIDRIERNRSRFIAEAVRHELKRRQRQELLRSLQEPHPDSIITAELGLETWSQGHEQQGTRPCVVVPAQGALCPDLAPGASGLN